MCMRHELSPAVQTSAPVDSTLVILSASIAVDTSEFFAATGITDGELLRGVRYRGGGATTESLVMRSRSGTIRTVVSEHQLVKLRAYSSIDFDNRT